MSFIMGVIYFIIALLIGAWVIPFLIDLVVTLWIIDPLIIVMILLVFSAILLWGD